MSDQSTNEVCIKFYGKDCAKLAIYFFAGAVANGVCYRLYGCVFYELLENFCNSMTTVMVVFWGGTVYKRWKVSKNKGKDNDDHE